MQEFYEVIRSLWVLWLMLLFIGIVAWVLWPSRRRKYRDAANIPLDDDEPNRARPESHQADRHESRRADRHESRPASEERR